MKIKVKLSLIIISYCLMYLGLSADEVQKPDSKAEWYNVEKALYKLKPGDKLEAVAERFLGGKEFTKELMSFNQITDPASIGPGFIIVLPGSERAEAVTKTNLAKESLEVAKQAAAEKYAPDEYRLARETIDSASNTRESGSYDKATALAELGKARADHAKKLADERAVIQQPGRITALHGQVEISPDQGISWNTATDGMEFTVADTLRTGVESRSELTLGDGSVVQMQPSTEFKLGDYRIDRRNNKRTSQLQVKLGSVLAKIKSQKHAESTFKVKSRSTILAVRGTDFRVGTDSLDTTRVSLLEGDVLVSAKDEELDLDQDFGTYVEEDTVPVDPIQLIPPPMVLSPQEEIFNTSNQVLTFRWDHRALNAEHKNRKFLKRMPTDFAKYHLEFARDTAFNYIVQEFFTGENFIKTDVFVPGNYYWRISSIDENGLEGPSSDPKIIRIVRNQFLKLTPGNPPLVRGNKWIIGPGNVINVQSLNDDTSVVSMQFSLNNLPYQETDGRIFFRNEGEYLLKVRGIAADGKPGETVEQLVELDTTPPAISIFVSPVTKDPEIGEIVYVSFDVIDKTGVESIEYKIDNSHYNPYTGRFKVSVENPYEGIHVQASDIFGKEVLDKHFKKPKSLTIHCHAIDLLGNRSVESYPLKF